MKINKRKIIGFILGGFLILCTLYVSNYHNEKEPIQREMYIKNELENAQTYASMKIRIDQEKMNEYSKNYLSELDIFLSMLSRFDIANAEGKLLSEFDIKKEYRESFEDYVFIYQEKKRYGQDIFYKKENEDKMYHGFGPFFPKYKEVDNIKLEKLLSNKECVESFSSYDRVRKIMGNKIFFSWYFEWDIKEGYDYLKNCTDPAYYPIKPEDIKSIDIGYEKPTYTLSYRYGANGWGELIFSENEVLFVAPGKSKIKQGENSKEFLIDYTPTKSMFCNLCNSPYTVVNLKYDTETKKIIPLWERDEFYVQTIEKK